jgi:CBS domain-containing protein
MGNVRNILKTKGNAIFSVTPDTLVYDALELMFEKNISALVVLEDGKLKGIFTEKDYARKLILQGKSSKETVVGEIMTDKPVIASPDNTIEECMHLMTDKFVRHLPILQGDELLGVISIGDVVKYIINEQKFIIENMEHYITGS